MMRQDHCRAGWINKVKNVLSTIEENRDIGHMKSAQAPEVAWNTSS
jgi:hypothetical protein